MTNEDQAEAVAAARAVVASLQDAFNAHDPVAISEHFADQAAWATVMGHELAGREEIAAFGASVMDRLAGSYARYEVTRTLPLATDVIAVRVRQVPTTATGEPTDEPRGAALYVVARRHGGWRIVAGQVTFLVETPAAAA
jgi:uncharacterized protein (TIGR02246 family)